MLWLTECSENPPESPEGATSDWDNSSRSVGVTVTYTCGTVGLVTRVTCDGKEWVPATVPPCWTIVLKCIWNSKIKKMILGQRTLIFYVGSILVFGFQTYLFDWWWVYIIIKSGSSSSERNLLNILFYFSSE